MDCWDTIWRLNFCKNVRAGALAWVQKFIFSMFVPSLTIFTLRVSILLPLHPPLSHRRKDVNLRNRSSRVNEKNTIEKILIVFSFSIGANNNDNDNCFCLSPSPLSITNIFLVQLLTYIFSFFFLYFHTTLNTYPIYTCGGPELKI